ncbi:hypothetical protein J4E85_011601 [Alternaria conjuncta]|uniref:uncharacterized protein n=1 Tax=Alternaria conjuncta TaxID=181017 RepID=UPI00221F646E|nr:uncharacterized protein J4E85_011601 [Alternaria conjuncta]KAI4909130.1 hypothetical protein J4E85_011601 [Alternaria conjuncta]
MPPKTPNLKGAEPPGDTQAEAQERRQAISTIIANWGPAFSTMTSWMHADTWLQGSTERMTEFTCDMRTIRAFRDLSIDHPNQGQEVKDQIEQYYILRYHSKKGSAPIGKTKSDKMGYICEDLQKLLGNNFIDHAKFKQNNTKKRPAAGKGARKKSAARKKAKKNNTSTAAAAAAAASDDEDEDETITSEVDEDEEEDESHRAPNPKPATKPANNVAGDGNERITRSHGKSGEEKGAQQTERRNSNANEAEDDDTSIIFSEPPEAETIHTSDDRDAALALIYSNWQINSLHRDFPAILRGGDPDAEGDSGIEDVIVELLRDLSNVSATKRQGKKISEELEVRCKRMKRYSLKAVCQAITATAKNYRRVSVSEDSLGLSSDEGGADGQVPQPDVARPAARPNGHRRYATRSDEASEEMQAAWDAVVVAEAAVRVAQDKRTRAAFKSETTYQQATRQLRVSEAQLRAAEEYAKARSLGRPQRVDETAGPVKPGRDGRTQRRSGDGGGVVEGREQNRKGGAGDGGYDGVDVREGEGNDERDEEERVA